ncbi:MAG: class I SAM-dependent methyltransferase [archaeon]
MKPQHLSSELAFYKDAFSDNRTRRERKYSWMQNPSRTVVELAETNGLDGDTQNKRVLDLGCGDGRHSEHFLSLGYQVVGVDFCEEAVEICTLRFEGRDANFHVLDLTQRGSLSELGQFDVVIDWSVLDHVRSEYLPAYIANIYDAISKKGHLFLTAFTDSLPGLFKNKRYKVVNGHYSRGYTVDKLVGLFPGLKLVDERENVLEDEINDYRFHTILMRK